MPQRLEERPLLVDRLVELVRRQRAGAVERGGGEVSRWPSTRCASRRDRTARAAVAPDAACSVRFRRSALTSTPLTDRLPTSPEMSTLNSHASLIFTFEKFTPWNQAPLKSASKNRSLLWSAMLIGSPCRRLDDPRPFGVGGLRGQPVEVVQRGEQRGEEPALERAHRFLIRMVGEPSDEVQARRVRPTPGGRGPARPARSGSRAGSRAGSRTASAATGSGGTSRFFSAVVRPLASTKPSNAADMHKLIRDTTWSVIVSSVKIGTGGRSLSPCVAQCTCRCSGLVGTVPLFEHDLVAFDALDVAEPHDVLDLRGAARARRC